MKRHDSQRGYFAYELFKQMKKNKDIHVIVADLGYGMMDDIRDTYPERFHNVGASEQLMVGMAIGLAMKKKIPIVYSITPFTLYRPFEWIRNYIDGERIPVILIGGGRNKDYEHDGFTHWATEDRKIMKIFKNITCYWPSTKDRVTEITREVIKKRKPSYINLKR